MDPRFYSAALRSDASERRPFHCAIDLESRSHMLRIVTAVLLAASIRGCVSYEYDHELWLRVDGSGSVRVTGRPELWTAFKGLGLREGAIEGSNSAEAARALFEASGLRVRRTAVTRRKGGRYLLVEADFDDVNRIGGTPAFPDLRISLTRRGDRLVLDGQWTRPSRPPRDAAAEADGTMAVRFHLPSRIYDHKNAAAGVERGNIVAWRQDVASALEGASIDFGAVLDPRSILWSTVALFAAAIVGALAILGASFAWVVRRGRRSRARSVPG
jgi:hypothetical protein